MCRNEGLTAGLPTLVMIPGTLCDKRLFETQRLKLRGQANVVLVDYSRLSCRHTWAVELLKTLPGKFSLAGFSLGGIWALELMRLAPHRIDRVALIASNAQGASPRGKRRSKAMHRRWLEAGAASIVDASMPAYFHSVRARHKHQTLIASMAMNTRTPAALAQFEWAGHRKDGHQSLSNFSGPLLIVSGGQDRICPKPWQKSMVTAQPTAIWVELPRVGHFLPLEAPAKVYHLLSQWMARPVGSDIHEASNS